VHRPLGEQGEDGGTDVAAARTRAAAASSPAAAGVVAGELLTWIEPAVAGVVSVVHRKHLSIVT
jgi:hypothetical protein